MLGHLGVFLDNLGVVLSNLSEVYGAAGELVRARDAARRAIEIRESNGDDARPDHEQYVRALADLEQRIAAGQGEP